MADPYYLSMISDPSVQMVLGRPHPMERWRRERMMIALIEDIEDRGNGRIDPSGLDLVVLNGLLASKGWRDAKRLIKSNRSLALPLIIEVAPILYDLSEGRWKDGELNEEELQTIQDILLAFSSVKKEDEMHDTEIDSEARQRMERISSLMIRLIDKELYLLIRRMHEESEIISDLKDLCPGRGWDLSKVVLHRIYLSDLEKRTSLLRRRKDMERMLVLLGRLNGSSCCGNRVARGGHCSETHSLRLSDELQRMLPQESVNLTDERLRFLFYSKLCEKKLLTYELRGREQERSGERNEGPVIALVDTSGSMSGEPELTAKALILAMARRLLEQRRTMKAVLFSVETTQYELTRPSDGGQTFIDFLCHTFSGGTDFDAALQKGIESLAESDWENGDLLFITDGLSKLNNRGALHDWRCIKNEKGARMYTVLIGGKDAGGLERISDRIFFLNHDRWESSCQSLFEEISPQRRPEGSCWVTQ